MWCLDVMFSLWNLCSNIHEYLRVGLYDFPVFFILFILIISLCGLLKWSLDLLVVCVSHMMLINLCPDIWIEYDQLSPELHHGNAQRSQERAGIN